MTTAESIHAAKEKIAALIETQTRDGEQSKRVKIAGNDLFSLGQFIDDNNRPQRGIHGSATGLRVLGSRQSAKQLVAGLINYIHQREEVENKVVEGRNDERIDKEKIRTDELNTIKISEILYALHFVPPAVYNTHQLVDSLSQKLRNGLHSIGNENGWDYFVDQKVSIEILPTAHAMLALCINGYKEEFEKVYTTLCNRIDQSNGPKSPSQFAEMAFALYAICRVIEPSDKARIARAKELLNKLWASPYCTLHNDFEQNLEYWYNAYHDYVRIPWQMYVIAVASWISKPKFYTVNVQSRLTAFLQAVNRGGFKYEYSGPYTSTRTNAILYDCLDFIYKNIHKSLWYEVLIVRDKIVRFLGSKFMRRTGLAFGLGLGIYSAIIWRIDPTSKLSDLAPEFIGAAILTLITLGRKK